MSTLKQIQANRQNAQKSTGPRSVEGKAASRFNALESGTDAKSQVLPDEDPDQLEALLTEYRERFSTAAPERRLFVDTLVNSEWLKGLQRLEAAERTEEAEQTESAVTDPPPTPAPSQPQPSQNQQPGPQIGFVPPIPVPARFSPPFPAQDHAVRTPLGAGFRVF
jgi:hypothetical protein